ncbi:MAG: cytochrome c3 family protein [Oscillatoria sp. PMC 1068.18]|nr:cytochrome c3 family protein [Oscillatoria sp. PMC 1076.18]MEC4988140.1 cytochrome c3 family protein [Oscillatoria sp. PMC 1068.18]
MGFNWGRIFQPGKFFQSKFAIIGIGLVILLGLGTALALDQRSIFLPGETSDGHYLFETSCKSCHEGFKPVSNETCMRCHEAEMATDTHGAKKFRDPRWAEFLTKLDALTCTACHEEHIYMFGRGVHLKPDLCMACHEGVITGDVPSHKGFAADGCWTAGCHNYHDHRSISTGFLADNLDQPPMLPKPELPELEVTPKLEKAPAPDLGKEFLGGK